MVRAAAFKRKLNALTVQRSKPRTPGLPDVGHTGQRSRLAGAAYRPQKLFALSIAHMVGRAGRTWAMHLFCR